MSVTGRTDHLKGGYILRQQIEREVADWPELTAEEESFLGALFASGRSMQESGGESAA